jgi:outer membrane protein OmpA-like peptidoglycan-associated protein
MRAIKHILFTAILAASGVAAADRPPEAPDFHQPHTVRGDVDRDLAASNARHDMEPFDVVHFGFDSIDLDAVDREQIRAAAQWLASHPQHDLVVEGHTDDVGTPAYNAYLARRRAENVADALISAGAPEDRVIVYAFGENQPISAAARATRRVRIWATR